MREPQRGKREHQGVDPDRQRHQHKKRGGKHHTRCPHDAGRRPQVTRDDADAQQAAAMAPEDLLALLLAGVVRQRVKHHHPVSQPPPDQRRQNEHQRRNQPQRNRHHQRHKRQHRGAHGPSHTRDERPAFFALQVRKTSGGHQGHQGRRHQHRHRQQRHHHQHRRHSQHHHQRRHDGRHIPQTPALEPAPDAGQQRGGVEQSAHCLH